jgi:hypothetical protein
VTSHGPAAARPSGPDEASPRRSLRWRACMHVGASCKIHVRSKKVRCPHLEQRVVRNLNGDVDSPSL